MDKSIERLVRDALELRKVSDRLFRRALGQVTHRNVTPEDQREALTALMPSSRPRDIDNIPLLSKIDSYVQSTGESISFHAQIVGMHDKYKAGFNVPTWHLDDTPVAYDFVSRLGIKHPRILQGSRPLEDIEIQPGSVLKPVRGSASRGCYVIRSLNDIVHLADGRFFGDAKGALEHAAQVLTTRSSHSSDGLWYTEELLPGEREDSPLRDVKAHAFYGEIVLIRELERHDNSHKWAHWSSLGERVFPMTQEDKQIETAGFPQKALEIAQKISNRVPYPFVRIDLLQSRDDLFFGEFTPRPGSFASFNEEWDKILGERWVDAENRLLADLIQGKKFTEFSDTLASRGVSPTPGFPS